MLIEFLVDEMPHLLAAATVVVSRAGMGTLTELATLGKPALVVPMPDSHQAANARVFAQLGAVEVAEQANAHAELLGDSSKACWRIMQRRQRLAKAISSSMPKDAAERIATQLLS